MTLRSRTFATGLLLILVLVAAAAAQDPHFAADRPFDLHHVEVEGRIDLKAKTLTARVTLEMSALRKATSIRLDAVQLRIDKVTVTRGHPQQPRPVTFTYDGASLDVIANEPFVRGERVTVTIEYVCAEPEQGLFFFGPTEAEPGVPYQAWTQGETTTTRHWIPIFDRPNERMTSELTITAEKGLDVLSNGHRVSERDNGDGTVTVHWRQDKDHVPYLLTLVVGRFAIERELWRGRPVEYWVPPDREADIARSFRNTKRMLDFFSDRIGVEYPWDKYVQVVVEQFGWGGMENTSATTLNERTLHDERAAQDYSSDSLVAHELAHQWFGDLLTCKEWAHAWLNEGFATYFQALWSEHDKGRDHFLYNMFGKSRGAINGGKKLPIVYNSYDGPWQQFDSRAYPKGAWVLHMIRNRLGDDLWWQVIHHYVEKNAHQTVETSDLRQAIEEITGRSFERFFFDWTAHAGHPVVNVKHSWHADTGLMEVHVRQTQKGHVFHFPLRIEYGAGTTLAVDHEITRRSARFYVPLPERPTLVRVDPEYAVLMELTENKGRDLWLRQLNDDPNPILRARAAAHFGESKRREDRMALAEAFPAERFWGVQIEIVNALGASGGTPSRDVLLEALSVTHPKVRKGVVSALGRFKDDATVTSAREGIVVNGDRSYYVEAAAIEAWAGQRPENALDRLEPLLARRSHNEVIRQAVLRGIGAQHDPAATDLLVSWSRRGRQRRCRLAALEALGTIARSGKLDDTQTRKVVDAVIACLHKVENRRVKTRAAKTLRDLGEAGFPALSALEALAAHDANAGVRRESQEAIDKIRSGAPARVELSRLREELRKTREADEALRKRLDEIERKQPERVEAKSGAGGSR